MTITRETLELAAKAAGLELYESDALDLCVKLKAGQFGCERAATSEGEEGMSVLCQLCGLPRFEGAAGYVGPQCRCSWKSDGAIYQAVTAKAILDRISELEAKLKVAEAALYYVSMEHLTPHGAGVVRAALAKIKEAS